MPMMKSGRDDLLAALALLPPLAVQLYGDGAEAAPQRLLQLALALATAYAWASVFARHARRPMGPGLPAAAMAYVVILPGPVAWGGTVLALSFGFVFGREIFGGRPLLPPAMIGLAFAVFSFPEGGFEARGIVDHPPDLALALACLPGAAVLIARGALDWRIAAGSIVGAAAAALLLGDPSWWRHPALGAFAPGVLFLAAVPATAVARNSACWPHGILVGALIVLIRLASPDGSDGVVFAALLGGLFAPLLDRALGWRPGHG